jgi:hypothetical protein
MKIGALALCFTALAVAGAAGAQDVTINDGVRQMVGEMAANGEKLVGEIVLNEIEEGESDTRIFMLDPAKAYIVYSACDDDCFDLNLIGEDADGEWVDEDVGSDDVPILLILPGESGDSLTVTVEMDACDAEVCVYGIGLYETES